MHPWTQARSTFLDNAYTFFALFTLLFYSEIVLCSVFCIARTEDLKCLDLLLIGKDRKREGGREGGREGKALCLAIVSWLGFPAYLWAP